MAAAVGQTGPEAVADKGRSAVGRPAGPHSRYHLVRARRWLSTPDGRAVLVLVVVPTVLFVVPALAGYPAIAGDDQIQNFPLRIFSGQLIRQGHLPLWNPYLWSGTPLLGGMNAGSLYPFTFAFAVLPGVAAWVVNLLAAYWAGGLGLYALLRALRCRPTAALLGALSFAFGGTMAGQIVHLPIVQGMSWMPLVVLALLQLSRSVMGTDVGRSRGSPWPWVILLAASIGLILLTGEPRGMAEAEVVATVVTAWYALRPYAGVAVAWTRRAAFVGWAALGAVWASALGAVQILPGLDFINLSQRSNEAYSFVTEGSFHPQWSVLLLVPDLFGGDRVLGQPAYFNSYNLPEVTGYMGLLALVAVAALAVRSVGRRRHPQAPEWWMWLFLGLLGLLMAFGNYTPLGHVFVQIPFYNRVRLASRNLGIVDLALAVLLAYWIDRVLDGDRLVLGEGGWRRWAAAGGPLAALALCVVAIAAPGPLERAFSFDGGATNLGSYLRGWFIAQAVVAVAVLVLVLRWHRLTPRRRPRWLAAVLVADLVLFALSSSTGLVSGHATLEPNRGAVTAVLGHTGRFAIFDTTAQHVPNLTAIGQPDLNVPARVPSVQGYGSLVDNTYGSATGTHTLDTLSPCALAQGVFEPLRLHTVLALAPFLAPPLPAGSPPPMSSTAAASACPGAPAPGTATTRTWYLGTVVHVATLTVVPKGGSRLQSAAIAGLHFGVVRPDGATAFPGAQVSPAAGGRWTVRFEAPQPSVGVVASGSRAVAHLSDASVVTASGGGRYALDGELQDALGQSGWRYAGLWEGYARFEATHVRPPVWLAGSPKGARVAVVQATDWGEQVDTVTAAAPVELVRSEAYQRGWRAEAMPVRGTGTGRTLPVVADGLVQAVHVPAGSWLITFRYRPRGLTLGEAGTGAGLLALVLAGFLGVTRRRRRQPGPGRV